MISMDPQLIKLLREIHKELHIDSDNLTAIWSTHPIPVLEK